MARLFTEAGEALWKQVLELGLLGLGAGNDGTTVKDALIVHQEMGRALAAIPYLQTNAARLLLHRLGVAAPGTPSLLLDPASFGWTLRPEGGLLAFPRIAEHVLVARTGGGGTLDLCSVPVARLDTRPVETLDDRFPIHEADAAGSLGPPLAAVPRERLDEALRAAEAFSRAALCAEMLGNAERCLEEALEHLKTRTQFGRKLGAFQALQHKAADMAIRLEGMRAFVRALGEEEAAPATLAMAKAFVSEGCVFIAETCLQLYGAMGFTWEHGVHRRLRHARRAAQMLGSPSALRREHVRALL